MCSIELHQETFYYFLIKSGVRKEQIMSKYTVAAISNWTFILSVRLLVVFFYLFKLIIGFSFFSEYKREIIEKNSQGS